MQVLIKSAKIIDPGNPNSGKQVDILIKNGIIAEIGSNLASKSARKIHYENLHLSPGWLDIGTQLSEPGYEQRETLESLSQAAIRGGYTSLAVSPNTDPAIQRRSDIDSVLKKAQELPIKILPIGAATVNCDGKDLTEFMDMATSGAVAFSDGKNTITDPDCLSRTLLYALHCKKPIINRPLSRSINKFGVIHEGTVNIQLGLEGIPAEAETIVLSQDLTMQKYTNGHLIELGITSKDSIDLLKMAKGNIYAGVPAMNLLYTDRNLESFDTRFKVLPPLRSETDRMALIAALKSGILDFIISNHDPMEAEKKEVEFGLASYGASTLEVAFSMAWTALSDEFSIEELIPLLCHNPRKALKIKTPRIDIGEKAEMTLFDPEGKNRPEIKDIYSLSKSCPALGQSLKGKVFGTIIDREVNLIE